MPWLWTPNQAPNPSEDEGDDDDDEDEDEEEHLPLSGVMLIGSGRGLRPVARGSRLARRATKRSDPMTMPVFRALALLAVWIPLAASAAPAKAKPIVADGELLLFDAARHDPSLISHYTARWRKGSDLTPVGRPVEQGGERWVEIAYQGTTGTACSTTFLEAVPPPPAGRRYGGVKITIDCDRDDYPRISVATHFSDQTQLTCALTLDQGRHEYVVTNGFRRADFPPRWERLDWVWLSAQANGEGNDLVLRLRRIAMHVEEETKPEPGTRAADLFGRHPLSPQPKTVTWREGAFAARACSALHLARDASERTRTTARLFAERFHGHTGRRLGSVSLGRGLPAQGIVLRVAGSVEAGGKRLPLRPEGYALTVERERVRITGRDEAGLFYGTVTFLQLLTGSMRITETMPIPCVEIVDWPDVSRRLARLEHTHQFRNRPIRENRGIEFLMDWTDRFVAGNKLNVLFIDLSALVRHKRRPEFSGSERIYSLDDLRRFGEFCRERFVDLCPAWQVGGHATWWQLVGYHPELREQGWQGQADVTHPDHDAILRDCMLDVIEALRPKYVSPKSDEWWHKRRAGETPAPLLRGKTRAQAFLDLHLWLARWLRERGITMLVFHDMLTPYHNGTRYGLYRIIDRFPKDAIIQLWSGREAARDLRWFTRHGFTVWTNGTGFVSLDPSTRGLVAGYGKGLYSFGGDRAGLLDRFSHLSSMASLIHSADYGWNLSRREGSALDHERLTVLRHLLAVRPNPRAGPIVTPIDLDNQLTHTLGDFLKQAKPETYAGHDKPADLPAGVRDIGFIPMRIASADGRNCVVLRKGSKEATLPVRGRYSSLSFLHTAFVHDPKDPGIAGAKVRRWMYGWPCGEYVVHWDDGSHAVLPVRLTLNVKRLDTSSGNRATNDNRYVWSVPDATGSAMHFYQWEWVNPKPDRDIVRVVARHDDELDVALILLAVSGRSVRAN